MIRETLGGDLSKDFENAIVIQGPYVEKNTERCVRMFFEKNPNDLIVVCTYFPCVTLSIYERQILEKNEGGRLVYLLVEAPPKSDVAFWKTNLRNQNLQRLTSFIGIQYSLQKRGVKRVLKCRSDAFLGKPNVCSYLTDNYLTKYPPSLLGSKLKGRILTSDHTKALKDNIGRPGICIGDYHIADYWLFGFSEDLMAYFDMREGCAWNGGKGISTKFAVETNLAKCWMDNLQIIENNIFGLLEKFFIIVSLVEVECVWLKHWHSYEKYKFYGKKYLADTFPQHTKNWGIITHEKWLALQPSF